MKQKFMRAVTVVLTGVMILSGCSGNGENNSQTTATTQATVQATRGSSAVEEDVDGELIFDHSLKLDYAKNFAVDYYKGGYKLITISDGKKFLVVPEGKKVPEKMEENVIALQMPLDNILISSAPAMSLINSINSVDMVGLTTSKKDTWYIDNVINKMENNEIIYVGEYNAPDYEMLATQKPPFAVFSSMISTTPDVAAKLDELNIPYIVDVSSNEEHPLGRVEWVKFYGALTDKDTEAKEVFDKQTEIVKKISEKENTGKTVAIFYITSKGTLYARNAGDYMTKMLELAGGKYILPDLNTEKTGTTKMEAEEFYSKAKDSDFIIYIYSMGGKPEKLNDFLARNELLKDFKAVKEGNVWCTTPDFFQIYDTLGEMIEDINEMFTTNEDKLTYLFKLK